MEKIVEWYRDFQVWHYTVSHSTLLLRSVNVKGFDTRIDVVFSNVRLVLIEPDYDRLIIGMADSRERQEILGVRSEYFAKFPLFLINGGLGYVVAAKMAWHEDHGDHHAPSKFGPLRGTE